ncbi:DUF2490 domain-containing protein [Algoriphagus sp. A40]|uniref:DUF2490 domain-containing protein n=1 Tax=Algoriphagus sp. A40 TaxID=1945863 RepID=UPI0009C4EECE|nr:DUF2490 domain-containing protein [Algoriphagus sp. A40]OOG76194.1 hypothetical protein B0E43_09140 [Algoriphagus sp. A40]
MQNIYSRIRSIFPYLVLAGFCLPISSAFGQKEVLTSNQVWLQSYHEGRISSKWTALLDGGFRWRNGFDRRLAYIVRGGVGYSLSPKLRVGGGFAFMGIYGEKEIIRHEYRPYQEVLLKDQLGKLSISHRFRIEERIFKDKVLDFATVDFNFRFRYAVTLGIPLANLSSKDPNRRLVLNLGDEIFLNAGKEITHNTFDQNRLIISPTLQWNKSLSVSLTYNYQYASTPDADIYLVSHVGWLQIRHNLDFRNPHSKD